MRVGVDVGARARVGVGMGEGVRTCVDARGRDGEEERRGVSQYAHQGGREERRRKGEG